MSQFVNSHNPYGPYERWIKRPLDATLASLALIVLSPVMATTALVVKVKLGSPVIFRQQRPGKDERVFELYKYRTMTDERDEKGELLPDDMRLTSFGSWLRATSLDELPELINILRGDMAIVGPRPLLVEYLPWYQGAEKTRHCVRPGLTGLAQVSGRNYLAWNERLAKDAEYVKKITFLGDAAIVARTALKVLRRADIAVNTVDEGNLARIRRAEEERA